MTEAAMPATGRRVALWFLLLLLVVEAVLFSLHVVVNKVAMSAALPPLGYTFWYSFGAGLILLIVSAIRGDLPPIRPRHLVTYAIIGTTGLAFPFTLMTFVAPKLPSGIVSMLVVLSPLLTYLFSLIAKLETFRMLSVVGILCGLAGVLLLILPSASLPSADMVGWVLLCLLAPASLAATNVLVVVLRPPALSSLAMSTALLLAASVVLFPIMLIVGQPYAIPGPNLGGDIALIYIVLAGRGSLVSSEKTGGSAGSSDKMRTASVIATGDLWLVPASVGPHTISAHDGSLKVMRVATRA